MFNWSLCVKHFRLKFFPKNLTNILWAPKLYSALWSDYLVCPTHMKWNKFCLVMYSQRFFIKWYIFVKLSAKHSSSLGQLVAKKLIYLGSVLLVYGFYLCWCRSPYLPLLLVWKNIYWLLSVLVVGCLSCVQLANLII